MDGERDARAGLGLAFLGWTAADEQARAAVEGGAIPARVVLEHRDRFELVTADDVRVAQTSGRLRREGAADALAKPAVGDWVLVDGARIDVVLPRRTALVRKAAGRRAKPQVVAANVDVVFVVTAAGADVNARRLERYASVVAGSGARAVVVLTKTDLEGDEDLARITAAWPGVAVMAASGVTGRGIDALRAELGAGVTGALVGSSGVGKSTLLNALLGEARHATGDVRAHDARGRHTTTSRALVPLPGPTGVLGDGGLIIDSPGMRELAAWDADDGVRATFADIEALMTTCRFGDCRHEAEPGCAVRGALESGVLDAARYAAFQGLLHEQEAQADVLTPQDREEKRRLIKRLTRAAQERAAEKRGRR